VSNKLEIKTVVINLVVIIFFFQFDLNAVKTNYNIQTMVFSTVEILSSRADFCGRQNGTLFEMQALRAAMIYVL
jgi:hypothetical protein